MAAQGTAGAPAPRRWQRPRGSALSVPAAALPVPLAEPCPRGSSATWRSGTRSQRPGHSSPACLPSAAGTGPCPHPSVPKPFPKARVLQPGHRLLPVECDSSALLLAGISSPCHKPLHSWQLCHRSAGALCCRGQVNEIICFIISTLKKK